VDEKQHLVPEFYLRGFADGEQIALTERDLRRQFVTSVKRALKAGGFYNLTQEPIQKLSKMEPVQREQYLADLAVMEQMPGLSSKIIERNGDVVKILPGAIEALLSFLEGRGEGALVRVRESFPDISGDDRMWAAHFIALQFSRSGTPDSCKRHDETGLPRNVEGLSRGAQGLGTPNRTASRRS
jgi:Protein of unknown function (DUF4238)